MTYTQKPLTITSVDRLAEFREIQSVLDLFQKTHSALVQTARKPTIYTTAATPVGMEKMKRQCAAPNRPLGRGRISQVWSLSDSRRGRQTRISSAEIVQENSEVQKRHRHRTGSRTRQSSGRPLKAGLNLRPNIGMVGKNACLKNESHFYNIIHLKKKNIWSK